MYIIHKCMNTGVLCFSESHATPLHFSKRPTLKLVPVFTNQRKSEEDFHFHWKRQKAKIAFSINFYMKAPLHTPPRAARVPGPAPSPRPTVSISAFSHHTRGLCLSASLCVCLFKTFTLCIH